MPKYLQTREVSMSNVEMSKAAVRILKAMNDTQFVDGYTFEQTMMVALYVIGAGLKKHGVLLPVD